VPSIVLGRDPFSFELESGALGPAGRRARSLHEFIGVSLETGRLDLCSLALRGRLRGRVRHDDFCKRLFKRARLRATRTSRVPGEGRGRLPATDGCPSPRDDRRRFSGSGVEGFRTSTLPAGIAPAGDFAPAPIASGSSCREQRPRSLSGETWGEDLAAVAAPACMAGAARGPRSVRLPRRRTGGRRPEGPSVVKLPAWRARALRPGAGATVHRASAFFTGQRAFARDARPGSASSARAPRNGGEHRSAPLVLGPGPQRPSRLLRSSGGPQKS